MSYQLSQPGGQCESREAPRLRCYVNSYFLEQNRNCAETILCAAGRRWQLELDPSVLHALGSFGGGLGCGSLCGALAGSAAVLGMLSTKTVAHENPLLRPACSQLVREFRERFGSELCRELLPVHKEEGVRCLHLVEKAADLLEELVESYRLAPPSGEQPL